MKETNVTSLFMSYCPGHHVRVESGRMSGLPDINYCLPDGTSGWIEAKQLDEPNSENQEFLIGLSPSQAVFLIRRAGAKGQSWILVGIGSSTKRAEYFLIHGKWANHLQRKVTTTKLAAMSVHIFSRDGLIENKCALLREFLTP